MADPQENLAQIADLYVDSAPDITEENTYVDPDTNTIQFRDDAAVKLVIDDAARADNFINVNQWASGWTLTDIIYQSPATQSVFDGGNVGQANVPKYILSNHVSTILADDRDMRSVQPFILSLRSGFWRMCLSGISTS